MTNKTTAPVQSLHDQIMRLPCTPPKDANVNQMLDYKSGHRDARHAAAELAAGHEADARQAAPVAVPDGEAIREAIREALGDAYDCTRVWSAWGYGTMSQNDFESVAGNDERVDEIACAVEQVISAAPTPPAGPRESPCTPPEQQSQWVRSTPTEQARYWYWDGHEDSAPINVGVFWSPPGCFVHVGQLGIMRAIDCKEWGGWWMLDEEPLRPGDTAPPAQHGQLADAFMLVTPEQLARHTLTAGECPSTSKIILVSHLWRLHNENTANLPAAPGDTAAPEQAEQDELLTPCTVCGSYQDSCDACRGLPDEAEQQHSITSDKYRAELYDEVWQKARDMGYGNVTEALMALERSKEQAEQPIKWGSAGTVGNLIAQLRTIDPTMPVFASLRIEDRVMLKGLVASYEHGDGRFIIKGGSQKCVVIWTNPDDRQAEQPKCKTCGGTGFVEDGEIWCSEDGTPYENGPVKCMKDCPDCTAAAEQRAVKVPSNLRPLLDRVLTQWALTGTLATYPRAQAAYDELRALLEGGK